MGPSPLFVGIDVAKDTLDAAVRPTAETWTVTNDEAGIAALVAQVSALAPTLVVLEATGGLHGPLTAALATAGLPVVVVNPRQVRAFAHATGVLAKTDRIDARVLAHFADALRPTPRPLPDAATQELRAVLLRRRQLVEMLSAERTRLATAPRRIHAAIRQHLTWLERHLTALDAELTQLIQASPLWRAQDGNPRRIPPAGPGLAQTKLGPKPGVGTPGEKQNAPVIGGAPVTPANGAPRGRRAG